MTVDTAHSPVGPRAGRYYRFGRSLYHVEQDRGDHLLIEDCLTGELLTVPAVDLERMTEVSREKPAPA